MPPEGWDDEEYVRQGKLDLAAPGKSYPGKSKYADTSEARDLHLAIQRAAAAAANDGQEGWFDISQLRVWVGNPNVKVYSATLTKSASSDPPDH